MNYLDRLRQSAEAATSIACWGIDPDPKRIPGEGSAPERILRFYNAAMIQMAERRVYPGAVKFNIAFFEVLDRPLRGGFEGSLLLASLIRAARNHLPTTPIILDAKRGDIGNTSAMYAGANFGNWEADATTVPPYMGTDSVEPFTQFCNDPQGKGVYVLVRTSNPGARDFQDLIVVQDGEQSPLYQVVARKVVAWAREHPGVGAVVGATAPAELGELVDLFSVGQIPLLIPGVGAQGGTATDVIVALNAHGYDRRLARINQSRGLSHPRPANEGESPEDYATACVDALEQFNRECQ